MRDYLYSELFLKPHIDKQLKITTADGLIVITNTDLYSESFELTESICSEDELKFGCCEANMVKFKIANIFTPLKDKDITVTLTLNNSEDSPMYLGKYKVYSDKPTADRRYREIEAYDKMYEIINSEMSEWYNSVLPQNDSKLTMKEFRTAFVNYFGIKQEEVELVNDEMTITRTIEPSEISGKDIITAICEINGCFGNINNKGNFDYVQLNPTIGLYPKNDLYPENNLYPRDSQSKDIPKGLYISCEYEDYMTDFIDKLQVRKEENDIGVVIGSGDNCYIIEDNFLVYDKSTFELQKIANKLYKNIKDINFRPANIECVGNPCFEVGESIRLVTQYQLIETYILQRTLTGIQALKDNYIATGEKQYSENVNSVQKSIVQLKGKTNTLERTLEKTQSTISDVEEGLRTEITQTAEEITETISKEYQTKDDMEDYPTFEEMETSIEKSADGIKETISKSQRIWNVSEYSENELVYGYGVPNNNDYPTADYTDKIYVNQTDGKVYKVVNGVWTYQKQLVLITEDLKTEIERTNDGISMEVSKARTIYDTDGMEFDLYGWGTPTGKYNAVDYPLKYYFDQSNGIYYQSTQLSANEYIWTRSGQLDVLSEDFSTSYSQTEQSIGLKVSVGDVSNQISIEKGGVSIGTNRLTIDSDNFKLSGSGEVEAIGTIKSGSEGDYTEITGKQINFYENDNLTSNIYGNRFANGDTGMILALKSDFIGFTVPTETEGITVFKYKLSNKLSDDTYPYDHNFIGDAKFYNDLRVANKAYLPEIYLSEESKIYTMELIGEEYTVLDGSFVVTGTKDRLVETQNYGNVGLNALETPSPLFSDYGSGTVENESCYIYFDEIFAETINLSMEYFVNVTATSKAKIDYVEKHKGYFIVFGEDKATFDWVLTAHQKDYENIRLERFGSKKDDDIEYNELIFGGDNTAAVLSEDYAKELETDYVTNAIRYVKDFESNELEVFL